MLDEKKILVNINVKERLNNMNKKIGFIGCGKMASAIIKGIMSCSEKYDIKGSEINCEIAEAAQKRLGIPVLTDNRMLVMDSDVIFLAVKPNYVLQILEKTPISPYLIFSFFQF